MNRTRREQRPPEPDESRNCYTERTTVTENEQPPMKGPPQETGTTKPHD